MHWCRSQRLRFLSNRMCKFAFSLNSNRYLYCCSSFWDNATWSRVNLIVHKLVFCYMQHTFIQRINFIQVSIFFSWYTVKTVHSALSQNCTHDGFHLHKQPNISFTVKLIIDRCARQTNHVTNDDVQVSYSGGGAPFIVLASRCVSKIVIDFGQI